MKALKIVAAILITLVFFRSFPLAQMKWGNDGMVLMFCLWFGVFELCLVARGIYELLD
jgi:hypothetical protein